MPIGQLLIDRNIIDPSDLDQARDHQKVAGGSLVECIVTLGFVSAEEIARIVEAVPVVPEDMQECGLDEQFLLGFVLKAMHVEGLETIPALAERLKLSPFIIDAVMFTAKALRLVEVLGLSESQRSIYRYALTGEGRERASDALARCSYLGPAPVPIDVYRAQVVKQRESRGRLDRAGIERVFAHLVLDDGMFDRLGPAANSGASVLLYGEPGNGKTSFAEALGGGFAPPICVPYAIYVQGQIIQVFDPSVHEATTSQTADAADLDPRWVLCRRPTVITGGELTMEMLDLRYDAISKTHEAPMHMKAAGGTFIIDDFGRQRVAPAELLNRWIVPLQRRVDFLTLHTGKKLDVPFDALVVFSTNFAPAELMDDAALRRIPYKFHIAAPSVTDYVAILQRVCEARGVPIQAGVAEYLIEVFYPKTRLPISRAHPQFIIDHVIEASRFAGREPRLDLAAARDAAGHLLVQGEPPQVPPGLASAQ
jgi:hypothetical protein